MSIEDIILDRDRRGISALRSHLPSDYCSQAASLILENPGTAFIVTGFYILAAEAAETDGPPGAIIIGQALSSIGYRVVYVTDRYTAPLISGVVGSDARVVDFPIVDDTESKTFAAKLRAELSPSVIIAIERCGLTDEGLYRNMHGQDISPYNARVDYLFDEATPSVGIGDGGNEIGMGNLASIIPTIPSLVKIPCVTRTTHLVASSVSNWGGYGLVAALSEQRAKNLLPSVEAEQDIIKRTVDQGAVDGMSNKAEYKVDGFTLDENSQTLIELNDYLKSKGVTATA